MEKEHRVIGGRYLLKGKIGQGGSGSVYLCHDNKLHKDWAVKELTEVADAERSTEFELLKTISCNTFPRIVDIVKEEGNFYLIMDYIEGVSLKDKMISNVREVSTRGGNIFAVVNEGDTTTKSVVDSIVYIPKTIDILTPLISVVPLQLISYYIAKQKGCVITQPFSFAKKIPSKLQDLSTHEAYSLSRNSS